MFFLDLKNRGLDKIPQQIYTREYQTRQLRIKKTKALNSRQFNALKSSVRVNTAARNAVIHSGFALVNICASVTVAFETAKARAIVGITFVVCAISISCASAVAVHAFVDVGALYARSFITVVANAVV